MDCRDDAVQGISIGEYVSLCLDFLKGGLYSEVVHGEEGGY